MKVAGLTQRRLSQGYRSETAQDRAQEFMELFEDLIVDGLISSFIDFKICGSTYDLLASWN